MGHFADVRRGRVGKKEGDGDFEGGLIPWCTLSELLLRVLDHQFCSYISLLYKIMFFLSFVFYVFLIVIIISLEANTFLENNEMITLSRCFRKIYLLLLTLITVEVYAQINIFKLVFIFKLFYWFVEDLEGT